MPTSVMWCYTVGYYLIESQNYAIGLRDRVVFEIGRRPHRWVS